jgi:hypothetical protein
MRQWLFGACFRMCAQTSVKECMVKSVGRALLKINE